MKTAIEARHHPRSLSGTGLAIAFGKRLADLRTSLTVKKIELPY